MAFCMNCGQEIPNGAKFCSNCGIATGEVKTETSERKTKYEGELHKCPNCGELLEAFVTICPACKYELRGTVATSRVHELSQKIEKIDSVEEKIDLISNFYIPNTKEDIYEFFILAVSNIKADSDCREAWVAKLEQAYLKAKLVLGESEDFKYFQDLYDKSIKSSIKNQMVESNRYKGKTVFVIGIIMIAIGIIGILATHISYYSMPFMALGALGVIVFLVGLIMFVAPNKKRRKK